MKLARLLAMSSSAGARRAPTSILYAHCTKTVKLIHIIHTTSSIVLTSTNGTAKELPASLTLRMNLIGNLRMGEESKKSTSRVYRDTFR